MLLNNRPSDIICLRFTGVAARAGPHWAPAYVLSPECCWGAALGFLGSEMSGNTWAAWADLQLAMAFCWASQAQEILRSFDIKKKEGFFASKGGKKKQPIFFSIISLSNTRVICKQILIWCYFSLSNFILAYRRSAGFIPYCDHDLQFGIT